MNLNLNYVHGKCMNCLHKGVNLFVGFPKKFKVIYKQKMVDPCTTQKAMIKTIPLKYPPIVIIIIIIIIIRNFPFSLSGLTYPGTLFTIHIIRFSVALKQKLP